MLPTASDEILNEVQQEFEQTLIVPEIKPTPQWMLMPIGHIHSGKSTTTKILAEHFKLVRINTDTVRELLRKRGYSFDGCHDILFNIVGKYLTEGFSLAIDANNGSVTGLKYNAIVLDAFPTILQRYIHINPPEKWSLARLRESHRPWLFENADAAIAAYYKNKASFTMPDVPIIYTFDPSRDNMEQQLQEAIVAIEGSLHTV